VCFSFSTTDLTHNLSLALFLSLKGMLWLLKEIGINYYSMLLVNLYLDVFSLN
jgi:hypothetical protein